MEPCDGPFDDPAKSAQSAAMRVSAACDQREDAVALELLAMSGGVVRAVAEDGGRSTTSASERVLQGRDARDQWQQLRDVVCIGAGDDRGERHAAAVGHQMMLGARARAIGGIRTRFFPAPMARIEEESTTARDQSMRNASARSCRSM